MKKPQRTDGFVSEFPGQHPGEEVELVFRQHPVVMRKPLMFGLVFVLLSEMPIVFLPNYLDVDFKIFLGGIVITLLYWFYHWMGWYYSIYVLTDQRLIDIQQTGFFNRKVSEVGLSKIQSINYHIKGFQAAILKFGDITVQTYTGDWVMKSIHHPVDVHSRMMEVTRLVDATTPTS